MVRVAVSGLGLATVIVILTLLGTTRGPAPVASAQQQTFAIEGVISNGSAGGSVTDGLTVTLHVDRATGSENILTTSDDQGRFRFDDVLYEPESRYGVSLRFQGAVYGKDIDLAADDSSDPVLITVYDATTDDAIVSVTSASLLFTEVNRASQTIVTLEIIRLLNDSDTAYVPGAEPMQLLRFGLPPGATNLQLDTLLIGADFAQVDLGFALFASVPPGEHEIMFSYEFPYTGDEITLEKSYRYGADTVRVLAPFETVAIRSDQLGPVESVTIGERPYQIIESSGIGRGERITVQIGGLPSATAGDRVSRRLDGVRFEYAAPAALVVLMVGLLVYGGFWKRRRSAVEESVASGDREAERETIHQMIAELRESFESGTMGEDDYRRRLSVLNSQLTALGQYPISGRR